MKNVITPSTRPVTNAMIVFTNPLTSPTTPFTRFVQIVWMPSPICCNPCCTSWLFPVNSPTIVFQNPVRNVISPWKIPITLCTTVITV